MTERSVPSPFADDALRLRLFEGPPGEAEVSSTAAPGSGLLDCEEPFEGELPDDLLALGECLTSEAHSLASTYPAGSPDRLAIGEGDLVAATPPVRGSIPQTERVQERIEVTRPAIRAFGVGTAAAIGFVAIVGAAIYSAASDRSRDAIAEVELRGYESSGAEATSSSTAESGYRESLASVAGVPVRTVSLSLANDRDYRRLESLLRERSEPEQEAMFDLLDEKPAGEETAVRIAF